jgi:hypothetical protein
MGGAVDRYPGAGQYSGKRAPRLATGFTSSVASCSMLPEDGNLWNRASQYAAGNEASRRRQSGRRLRKRIHGHGPRCDRQAPNRTGRQVTCAWLNRFYTVVARSDLAGALTAEPGVWRGAGAVFGFIELTGSFAGNPNL